MGFWAGFADGYVEAQERRLRREQMLNAERQFDLEFGQRQAQFDHLVSTDQRDYDLQVAELEAQGQAGAAKSAWEQKVHEDEMALERDKLKAASERDARTSGASATKAVTDVAVRIATREAEAQAAINRANTLLGMGMEEGRLLELADDPETFEAVYNFVTSEEGRGISPEELNSSVFIIGTQRRDGETIDDAVRRSFGITKDFNSGAIVGVNPNDNPEEFAALDFQSQLPRPPSSPNTGFAVPLSRKDLQGSGQQENTFEQQQLFVDDIVIANLQRDREAVADNPALYSELTTAIEAYQDPENRAIRKDLQSKYVKDFLPEILDQFGPKSVEGDFSLAKNPMLGGLQGVIEFETENEAASYLGSNPSVLQLLKKNKIKIKIGNRLVLVE